MYDIKDTMKSVMPSNCVLIFSVMSHYIFIMHSAPNSDFVKNVATIKVSRLKYQCHIYIIYLCNIYISSLESINYG